MLHIFKATVDRFTSNISSEMCTQGGGSIWPTKRWPWKIVSVFKTAKSNELKIQVISRRKTAHQLFFMLLLIMWGCVCTFRFDSCCQVISLYLWNWLCVLTCFNATAACHFSLELVMLASRVVYNRWCLVNKYVTQVLYHNVASLIVIGQPLCM